MYTFRLKRHYLVKQDKMALKLLAPLLMALVSGITGCVTSEKSVKTINLDEPKISGGILVKDPDTGEFDKIVDLLEAQKQPSTQYTKTSPPKPDSAETAESGKEEDIYLSDSHWPERAGKLFDLPKLSDIELAELIDVIVLNFQTEQGFRKANKDIAEKIPNLPSGIASEEILFKEKNEGVDVIRLGYWTYKARAPRLGIYAALLNSDNVLVTHETKKKTPKAEGEPTQVSDKTSLIVKQALDAFSEMRQGLTYQDLESEIVRRRKQHSGVGLPA